MGVAAKPVPPACDMPEARASRFTDADFPVCIRTVVAGNNVTAPGKALAKQTVSQSGCTGATGAGGDTYMIFARNGLPNSGSWLRKFKALRVHLRGGNRG